VYSDFVGGRRLEKRKKRAVKIFHPADLRSREGDGGERTAGASAKRVANLGAHIARADSRGGRDRGVGVVRAGAFAERSDTPHFAIIAS
jgi:hypothetical protein